MSITPLDPATAGPAELDDCFSVKLAASAADLPNDPRPTRESTIGQLTAPSPPDQRRCRWAARDGDRIVGTALVVLLGRENSDAAFIDVTVHPDHRRRGLGTALLREMVAAAAGRQTLLMEDCLRAGRARRGRTRTGLPSAFAPSGSACTFLTRTFPLPSEYSTLTWIGMAFVGSALSTLGASRSCCSRMMLQAPSALVVSPK